MGEIRQKFYDTTVYYKVVQDYKLKHSNERDYGSGP